MNDSYAIPQRDALATELEAMATIGRVLAAIDDPGTRQRVLRWLWERFGSGSPPTAGPLRASDPTLDIGTLSDMFAPLPIDSDAHTTVVGPSLADRFLCEPQSAGDSMTQCVDTATPALPIFRKRPTSSS